MMSLLPMIVNSGPFSASYKQIDYQQIYENTWDFVLFLVVIAAVFIFAYLYFSTNWRPFKIIGEDDCPECGNPLHHGSSKCKWCGTLLVDRISDTDKYVQPPPRPDPKNLPRKKPRFSIPIMISAAAIVLVALLIFVFNVDIYCMFCFGLLVLLTVLFFLTQGSSLTRKHQEGNNLAKQADGRAYNGKR